MNIHPVFPAILIEPAPEGVMLEVLLLETGCLWTRRKRSWRRTRPRLRRKPSF
jgi:hypothetical protein